MNNMFTPAKHEKQSQKAKTYIQNSHILLFYITITCITSISTLEIILNCFAMDSITYYVRTNNIYGAQNSCLYSVYQSKLSTKPTLHTLQSKFASHTIQSNRTLHIEASSNKRYLNELFEKINIKNDEIKSEKLHEFELKNKISMLREEPNKNKFETEINKINELKLENNKLCELNEELQNKLEKNKLFPLQFALNKSDIILKNKTKENNLLLNSIKEMK
eukprot:394650_1